jgi:hypothetical protein
MPLESVTHISDLNQSNPAGTDSKNQGDDHLRNVKLALRTDLPNINGVVNCTPAQLNLLNSIAALAVLANATNAAAQPTAIVAASDGQVFRRSGTALAFGAVDLSLGAAVSNPTKYAIVTADVVFSATTALANIAALTNILAMDAASLYRIEGVLDYVASSGTPQFKFAFTFSNAPQLGRLLTAETGAVPGDNSQAIATAYTTVNASTNEQAVVIDAWVHTHATLAANFTVQGAQGIASGTTTLKKGSWIAATKIGALA